MTPVEELLVDVDSLSESFFAWWTVSPDVEDEPIATWVISSSASARPLVSFVPNESESESLLESSPADFCEPESDAGNSWEDLLAEPITELLSCESLDARLFGLFFVLTDLCDADLVSELFDFSVGVATLSETPEIPEMPVSAFSELP